MAKDFTSKNGSTIFHSTPKPIKDEEAKSEERDIQTVSPRTSAKLKLDELVSEHAHLIQPAHVEEGRNTVDVKLTDETAGGKDDRDVEFENLVNTDESSSDLPSTTSLLDDDDSRYTCVICNVVIQ